VLSLAEENSRYIYIATSHKNLTRGDWFAQTILKGLRKGMFSTSTHGQFQAFVPTANRYISRSGYKCNGNEPRRQDRAFYPSICHSDASGGSVFCTIPTPAVYPAGRCGKPSTISETSNPDRNSIIFASSASATIVTSTCPSKSIDKCR